MLAFNVIQEIKTQVKALITKDKDITDTIRKAVNDEIKRVAQHQKSGMIDYNMLTMGNVNLADRATPANIETYGNVYLGGVQDQYGNANLYTKMKNKINYGSSTDKIALNRGKNKIVR